MRRALAVLGRVSACLAVAAVACGGTGAATVPGHAASPERAPALAPARPLVPIKLLGINDFHGQLSPKVLSGRPVGGAAVLASYLRRASAGIEDHTIIVHAGDLVGASPLNSSLLQDEPAIMFLNTLANEACTDEDRANAACNVVGTLGNHEFDEGTSELLRLIRGGDSAKGPFIERPWRGARFPYVAANVVDRGTREPLFPPYVVKRVSGVAVAFIGATLAATPSIVPAPGIAGVEFLDEADAIDRTVREVSALGVHAIVVLIHDGLSQPSYAGSTDPKASPPTGPLLSVIEKLDDDVDVVVSGHTHHFTNALVANGHGTPLLVVQAFAAGTAYDDVDLLVDPATDEVVSKSARVVDTIGDAGVPDDPAASRIVSEADAIAAPVGNAVLGEARAPLSRTPNASGESALGDLIADAQRAAVHAQFAFVNPGGVRDDLAAGTVTFGALFAIQPFGNTVTQVTLTGAQIYDLLNQQWGPSQPEGGRVMQIAGLSYTWDSNVAAGSARVVEVRDAARKPIERSREYVIAVNDYMLAGGDNFTVLAAGKHATAGPVDVKALADYVKALPRPFSAPPGGRITRR